MSERSLDVSINGIKVGRLREVDGVWAFKYSEAWLGSAGSYALSPSLPLHKEEILDLATTRPVQRYFDNLLPEEGQRILLAKDAGVGGDDAFGLMEAYGAESAGSLTLARAGDEEAPPGERGLSFDDLKKRLDEMPRVALSHYAPKQMSHAGAQHKLAVIYRNGLLYEPVGSMPSTHILKPNHPDDAYPHSVINEYFIMKLAEKMKLSVPNVYRIYVPSPVYLIERFDRVENEGHVDRIHAIDACQMLGIDRSAKYRDGGVETLSRLVGMCRNKIATAQHLYRWVIFNVLTGNTDAHLKNLSFLVSGSGISLAPHYDLLSTACYETQSFGAGAWPDKVKIAWTISGKLFISDLDRDSLVNAGVEMGVPKIAAQRIMDGMVNNIICAADALIAVIESENSEMIKARPELGVIFQGEMRCLRAIRYVVIGDMCRKISLNPDFSPDSGTVSIPSF